MKKIFGRILVKETNSGVPNLVVTAYDSEIELNHECFTEFSLNKVGKRIGSMLTDSDGTFTFTFDDLHFSGTEERPDLLLIVFAPEDIKSPETPFPLSPEKRILYISRVPRTDAGAEEAYVIRLLQKQLDNFSIQTNTSSFDKTGVIDSAHLFNAIQRSWDFNDSLKEKLKPRLQKQYDDAIKIRQEAKDKFKNLSAIPLEKRGHPLLITNPAKLQDVQKQVIEDGLKKLNNKAPFTINVTNDELKLLRAKDSKNLDPAAIVDLITSKIGGVDLIRKNTDMSLVTKDIQNVLGKYLAELDTKVPTIQ